MTHDELLDCITKAQNYTDKQEPNVRMTWELNALRAVVQLHKPVMVVQYEKCEQCLEHYPCTTIEAIMEQLK